MSNGPKHDLSSLGIPPGDTMADAVGAFKRLVARAHRRCEVVKRRYERMKTPTGEHNFLLTAQEYYYVARLAANFVEDAKNFAIEDEDRRNKAN